MPDLEKDLTARNAGNIPAFPWLNEDYGPWASDGTLLCAAGITVLDYFAAKIAAELFGSIGEVAGVLEDKFPRIAELSYKAATAMVKERMKYL